MKLKVWISEIVYWSTLVGPIYDIIVGAYRGIRENVLKYSDNRRFIEEMEKMNRDNERKNYKW